MHAIVCRSWAVLACLAFVLVSVCHAYSEKLEDKTEMRQSCSGVWAGRNTSIDVMFYSNSSGLVTTIIYEITELDKIGKYDPAGSKYGHHSKTYLCTPTAQQRGLCKPDQLNYYVIDDELSPWSIKQERMDFGDQLMETKVMVNRTGYYCMGVAPLRAPTSAARNSTINQFHGEVVYQNRFTGHLPAAEHPKLYVRIRGLTQFYGFMTIVCLGLSAGWIFMCYKQRDQIVTVQHFVSAVLMFLVVEMACQWYFYRYYNSYPIDMRHFEAADNRAGVTSIARFLLVLTNILESVRDCMSFFLLLIVSMGYGVVRPTIGPVIIRVYALTSLHFVFSVMYSIGIIFVLLDTNNAWVGAFIFPMAFTLTIFYMWILSSLKSTIQDLQERHQTFKMNMFKRLQVILLGAVVFLTLYFFGIIGLIAFTGTKDFIEQSWKYRWFVLEGVLVLLYLVVFGLIAWSWRPTGNNMRLAMSDELATDEEAAAGQFEVHTIGSVHEDLDEDAEEVESVHLHQLSRTPKDTSAPQFHVEEPDYAAVDSDDDYGHDDDKHSESKVLFESDERHSS